MYIFDSYVSWNASPKLSLALEGDYVVERLFTASAPAHTDGGAAYVCYQLTPKFALANRAECMSDRGGLFSGTTQALKEVTLTGQYQFYLGFMMFEEWRRDFSNRPYFLTDTLGLLQNGQTTATAGMVWWFGPKANSR
ncbi:MAG TPA: outer membrane beta-barrel protein [Candidatus Acidoferrales bacterium]|nr:outer membrane beta-barrel protein [Candidatus Acidoferrales bacterium]